MDLEKYTTGTGQNILVHTKKDCKGEYCCIHRPSDHHMVDWPTNWRADRNMMERIDPMGVGHPDPDDLAFRLKTSDGFVDGIHGCNGLCSPKGYENYLKTSKKKEN